MGNKCNARYDVDEEYIGKTFGYRTIIADAGKKGRYKLVLTRCKCGKEDIVPLWRLRTGQWLRCKNCGQQEKNGGRPIKERSELEIILAKRLHGIKKRCYQKNDISYKYCGAKGVIICDEWKKNVNNFISWALANGFQKGLTIDRIDPNGNYEPSNCRCVPMTVQEANRRKLKTNTSGYTGVRYNKRNKYSKWGSFITTNKEQICLGYYKTQKEALEVRNNYIKEHNLPHPIQEYVGELYKEVQ